MNHHEKVLPESYFETCFGQDSYVMTDRSGHLSQKKYDIVQCEHQISKGLYAARESERSLLEIFNQTV